MARISLCIKVSTLVCWVALLPLAFAVLLGLKQYAIWSQVTYLWDGRSDPLEHLSLVTPHSLRYALMYPLLIFSEGYRLNHDDVFSIVVLFLCFFTGRNILATIRLIDPRNRRTVAISALVMSMTVGLFFPMNGRISLAFFGYSILLRCVVQIHYHKTFPWTAPFVLLFAVFLCGVSSGTLFSACGTLLIALAFELGRNLAQLRLTKTTFWLIVTVVIVAIFFLDFVLVGVFKNLLFYGGGYNGFLLMLQHGFGGVLYPFVSALSFQTLIVLGLAIPISGSYLLSRLRYSFLLHVLLGTMVFGAFGFSTLTMAFMPAMTLLGVKLRRMGAPLRA